MKTSQNTLTSRRSLESFKATAAAAKVQDQIQMITGGALAGCHIVAAKV